MAPPQSDPKFLCLALLLAALGGCSGERPSETTRSIKESNTRDAAAKAAEDDNGGDFSTPETDSVEQRDGDASQALDADEPEASQASGSQDARTPQAHDAGEALDAAPDTSTGVSPEADGGTAVPDAMALVDASTDAACSVGTGDDLLAGTWRGVQVGIEFTFVLLQGNITVTSLTDQCSGSYTLTGAASATSVLHCTPLSAAGFPAHTDIGTYAIVDGRLEYTYQWDTGTNAGTAVWSGNRVCE